MTRDITLRAVPYRVTEQDNQIIFLANSGFAFCHSQFTIEWKRRGWYLVAAESSAERIYLPHLAAALRWLEAHYPPHYVDGTVTKGTYQDEPITNPQ